MSRARTVVAVVGGLAAVFNAPATAAAYPDNWKWWEGRLASVDGDAIKDALFFAGLVVVLVAVLAGPIKKRWAARRGAAASPEPAELPFTVEAAQFHLLAREWVGYVPDPKTPRDHVPWLALVDGFRITNRSATDRLSVTAELRIPIKAKHYVLLGKDWFRWLTIPTGPTLDCPFPVEPHGTVTGDLGWVMTGPTEPELDEFYKGDDHAGIRLVVTDHISDRTVRIPIPGRYPERPDLGVGPFAHVQERES